MMKKHVGAFLLLATATALFAQAPGHDVVELQNGATFRGTILSETPEKVVIKFPGGTMELPRERVKQVSRGTTPAGADLQRSLLTLSRFPEFSDHHFLYRDGKRVGYRTLALHREAEDGIPGYQYHDRLVFAARPGADPEVDVRMTEFVDAELSPRSFRTHVSSGKSVRILEGKRVGEKLQFVEQVGGRRMERSAFFRPDTEMPRFLLRKLAAEPPPEGGYPTFRLFRPRDGDFGTVELTRHVDRVSVRGTVKDVLIFRMQSAGRSLEIWLDMAGRVLREEIGSSHLVSVRAPREDVLAWSRGEEVGDQDLGLEFVSEATGLRLLRPDQSWEMVPGVDARRSLVTLLRPGNRATVDVFQVEDLVLGSTEEGVALDLITRMEAAASDVKVVGPEPGKVGEASGLRFQVTCLRRGTRVTTRGGVLLDKNRAFVILCTAPTNSFQEALPGFLEVMDSLRVLNAADTDAETRSPFNADEPGK